MLDAAVLQQNAELNLQCLTDFHRMGSPHVVFTVFGMYQQQGHFESALRCQGFLNGHVEETGVFRGTGFEPSMHAAPLIVTNSGDAFGCIEKGEATRHFLQLLLELIMAQVGRFRARYGMHLRFNQRLDCRHRYSVRH